MIPQTLKSTALSDVPFAQEFTDSNFELLCEILNQLKLIKDAIDEQTCLLKERFVFD